MRDQGPFQFWSEVRQGGHEARKHRGVKRRNRFPGVPQWTTTAGFHGLTPDLATGGGLGALRATHLPYLQQEEYLAPILAVVIILPSESAGHSRSALARQEPFIRGSTPLFHDRCRGRLFCCASDSWLSGDQLQSVANSERRSRRQSYPLGRSRASCGAP